MYNLADNFANAVQYEGDNSEFMVRVTLLCTISQTTLPMLYNMKVTIVSLWYVLHYYESFTVITSSIRTRWELGNKRWRRKKTDLKAALVVFIYSSRLQFSEISRDDNYSQPFSNENSKVWHCFVVVYYRLGFLDIHKTYSSTNMYLF